jgi:hypothetical protein
MSEDKEEKCNEKNLMNSAHKGTNPVYRNEYDRIFRGKKSQK